MEPQKQKLSRFTIMQEMIICKRSISGCSICSIYGTIASNGGKTEESPGIYDQYRLCIIFDFTVTVLYWSKCRTLSDQRKLYAIFISWKYDHDDYLLLYGNIVVRVPEYQRREKLVDNIEKGIYHIKHIGKESI